MKEPGSGSEKDLLKIHCEIKSKLKSHILEKKTVIKRPVEEVFDFFTKAENLNKITPPFLGFKILTPLPVEMKKGALIDYVIRLNGIPMKWKTEITKWEPPYKFEDTQIKGPYKIWIHEHKFEPSGNDTLMTDTVNYFSRGGILEFIPHNLIVKNKVKEIFDYREKTFAELFPELKQIKLPE
ncbi:MAG: SRPBCC family protein [Bacteroidetes bacterium]|nr:SRPBCC family protein [Bacteroidota bacterium]